jgi:hypothetical protein
MSYILEALRKSQQDREIGQVPTLATQPLFTSQESGRNAWGLAAMALAGLAVAIALYAALRGGPEVAPPAPPRDPDSGPRPGWCPGYRARAGRQPRSPGDPASCRGTHGGFAHRPIPPPGRAGHDSGARRLPSHHPRIGPAHFAPGAFASSRG